MGSKDIECYKQFLMDKQPCQAAYLFSSEYYYNECYALVRRIEECVNKSYMSVPPTSVPLSSVPLTSVPL